MFLVRSYYRGRYLESNPICVVETEDLAKEIASKLRKIPSNCGKVFHIKKIDFLKSTTEFDKLHFPRYDDPDFSPRFRSLIRRLGK